MKNVDMIIECLSLNIPFILYIKQSISYLMRLYHHRHILHLIRMPMLKIITNFTSFEKFYFQFIESIEIERENCPYQI